MIRTKLALQQIALRVGLYVTFSAAFWVAYWIRFHSGWISVVQSHRGSDYVILYLVAIVAWGFLCHTLELDELWVASNPSRWFRGGVWATIGTVMIVGAGTFFIRTYSFSRLFIVILGALMLIALAVNLRVLLSTARRPSRPGDEINILIVGDARRAAEVAARVTSNSWIRCKVTGYVAVNGEEVGGAIPRLGALDDLEQVCREARLDEILVAVPLEQLGFVPQVKRALARVSVPSRLVCDFLTEVASGGAILDFFGTPVVDLHRNPGDSLVYGLLKRSFDLLVASALLVLLAPVAALVAILVKLTSAGPVFFSQKRVGLHGRPFTIYKFRTMHAQSGRTADEVWTTADDERCTPLGVFLRRFNLDELPQFWNVVLGNMSLVGPRPERPHFVERFAEEIEGYNIRHFLKCGITGWAQVNGWRGDTSIARRIEYDLYYLTHWSFGLDLKILWLTLWRGFRDKNAY